MTIEEMWFTSSWAIGQRYNSIYAYTNTLARQKIIFFMFALAVT